MIVGRCALQGSVPKKEVCELHFVSLSSESFSLSRVRVAGNFTDVFSCHLLGSNLVFLFRCKHEAQTEQQKWKRRDGRTLRVKFRL